MTHTNTIKITEATNLEINAVIFAKKTPWVIFDTEANQIVGVYMGRTEAREAKAAGNLKGQVLKASDCAFEVISIQAKPYGFEDHGFTHCPHCGIDLDNGVGEHMQEVNGKPIKHNKFQYECLGCGEEFGPEIKAAPAKEAKPAKKQVAHVNKSEIENPCKRVWHIADEMLITHPGAKRKQVLEACQAAGIAFYTARTQYQQWLSVRKEMAEREAQQAKK